MLQSFTKACETDLQELVTLTTEDAVKLLDLATKIKSFAASISF